MAPGSRWRSPWTLVGGKRSTGRKPGKAPRRGKKAEREGGRERTKQRKTTPRHTPEKTSTDTMLASDRAKTDKTRVTAKVRSRKFIQKRGLRKVELCQKEGTLSEKNPAKKSTAFPPPKRKKLNPNPSPNPLAKVRSRKFIQKRGLRKGELCQKEGTLSERNLPKNGQHFPLPDTRNSNPTSPPTRQ